MPEDNHEENSYRAAPRDLAFGAGENVPHEGGGSVALGVLLALALQFAQLFVFLVYPPAVLLIGVTQLVYTIPAILIARRKGRPKLSLGLIIGAVAVFLLNATCWGYVGLQFHL